MSHAGSHATQTMTPPIRVICGPAPCHDCGAPLVYGRRLGGFRRSDSVEPFAQWMERDGAPHMCTPEPWIHPLDPTIRVCPKCLELRHLKGFSRDHHRKDHLDRICKACERDRRMARGAA